MPTVAQRDLSVNDTLTPMKIFQKTFSKLKVPFIIVLDQNQHFNNLKTKIRCDK